MMAHHRANLRQAINRVLDVIVLLLFAVPALQPLMADAFTCGYDNVFHLWRAVQIESLWQQGVLYSRWAPAMAHGLGFPLYLFASPFPPSLVALLHQLGANWAIAMNVVFAVGIILGGLAMVKLARELFGYQAGWVAGVAYIYAPFQAYEVFNRGSLWEAFAWAWPPFVLWGLHRWVCLKDRSALWIGVAAFMLMMLSHHLFAFLFAPLLVLWVILLAIQMRDFGAVGRGALLGLLGLGVTAFFWLPPMAERVYIQTGRLLGTWVFDYRHNFLSLDHLLAPPRFADPNLVNDWPQKSLGMVPVLLGLISLVFWRQLEVRRRGLLGGLLLLTFLYALLTLPVSQFLWDRLPLLSYVQFPWRYLGPATFCLALLIGVGTAEAAAWFRGNRGWHAGALPVFVMVVIVFANLGWFFPDRCPPPSDISVAAMIRWEYATDTLGTTAKGEYLPIWSERLASPTSLLEDYESGGPVIRLPSESLPDGAVIHAYDDDAVRATIRLSSPESFVAHYLALYYPGWQVTIDGRQVPVTPEPETGLLTFRVPAGTHEIMISFRETPLRRAADLISLLSFITLILLSANIPGGQQSVGQSRYSERVLVIGCVAGMGLIAMKLGPIDRYSWLWRDTRLQEDGSLQYVDVPMQVNFGNRAMLLGSNGLTGKVPSGATTEFTLFWSTLDPGEGDWHIGLSLVNSEGTSWPVSLRPARWARTPPPLQSWPPRSYARMDKLVDLSAGIPPGVYTPTLSLFDRKTLQPASILGVDGNPVGPSLPLAPIRVIRPDTPATLDALDVPAQADIQACGALGLWLAESDRRMLAPGESIHLRWVWEALRQPNDSRWVRVLLEDDRHTIMQTWEVPPVSPQWSTDKWQQGDRWVGRLALRLPGFLESGKYVLKAQFPFCDLPLAEIPLEVNAPERSWVVPDHLTIPEEVSADWIFGSLVRLAGYSVADHLVKSGSSLEIQLAWQALDEIATPYRVFIHLIDDSGHIVAQSDGEPANWTRPTTGWAKGEVVVETRVLILPENAKSGTYNLLTGIYDETGDRLYLPDGTDAAPLGKITIP